MWTSLRKQIEQTRKQLNLSEERFNPVSINQWNQIQDQILETFVYTNKIGWIWERIKMDQYSIQLEYNNAFNHLLKLVDESEKVWLFVNDTISERTKYWFYEGFIKEIVSVIYECPVSEVYIASKKYEWLLCINHHDYLIGSGEVMTKRLMDLEMTLK